MSTSEYRSVDAEGDLPISAAELAALATQLFAAASGPARTARHRRTPLSPRGNAPDIDIGSFGRYHRGRCGESASHRAAPAIPLTDVYVPTPTSPEPEGIPQTVPVAPRGNAPDTTAAPSVAYTVESVLNPYAVPTSGIVPTVPGVLAGSAPTAPVAPRGIGARLAAGRTDDR